MTAPASAHPRTVDDLYPGALALTDQLGEVPSRNRLQKEFKIGAPKATELRERLLTRPADPPPPSVLPGVDQWDYPAPIGPDPAPPPTQPEKVFPLVRVDGHPGPKNTDPAPVTPDATTPDATTADATPVDAAQLKQFKRIRWAVRLALALGVAASIAGNVLHAQDRLISQVISAWSPLALLLTIELISRVPVHSRRLAIGRWAATALIAGIAAWVSYWHMAAVAAHYGEINGAQYLLPLSVDGLVVVASICLVELGGRIAANTRT